MKLMGLAIAMIAMGCGSGDDTSGTDGGGDSRPAAPDGCEGHIIPAPAADGCHDSTECWFDESENEWHMVFCDPPVDPCTACEADEICVQSHGGVCSAGIETHCAAKVVECPNNACSDACEAAYCGGAPYQCDTRPSCGDESPLAFTCYGP